MPTGGSTAPNTTATPPPSTTLLEPTSSTTTPTHAESVTVVSITDGDTIEIELADGTIEPLRLIGVNAPEPGECFADESAAALAVLLSGTLTLESDASDRDQFGRLLRYIYADGILLNAALVESGHALSHNYPPDTAHQAEIDEAQTAAQASNRGIWATGACGPTFAAPLDFAGLGYNPPGDDNQKLNEEWVALRNTGTNPANLSGWQVRDESSSHRFEFPTGFTLGPGAIVVIHTGCGTDTHQELHWCNVGFAIWNNAGDTVFVLDPNGNIHTFLTYDSSYPSDTLASVGITTTTLATTTTQPPPPSNCHPSYPTVCIPPPPPDLDCGEISYRNFAVTGSDPHGFDGDNDGAGCET